MKIKKKLFIIKDVIDCKFNVDESKETEQIILADKQVEAVECELINIIQQTLSLYHCLQKLRKDIEILEQNQKKATSKLNKILKSVDQAKKDQLDLEKKKALRGKIYDLYKCNLGFEIKPLKGGLNQEQTEIMFSFRCINKNKPEEEYSFILVLNGQIYDVKDYTPALKGIDELLSELNETNDLSAFVIQARRNICTATAT